ncbi:MAG: helix-turn-helix domain-containing protein, partial [Candidatus Aenigmarchaeota archaeon]|nr:helix-turn-helix domain-containing protein [Candidatus Aenigmarchaeota archaeon]
FVDFIGRNVERSLDLYLDTFKRGSEYISLAEAAEGSPYSQEYLSLLARKGRLESIKLGRNWFVKKEAIKRYIKSKKK